MEKFGLFQRLGTTSNMYLIRRFDRFCIFNAQDIKYESSIFQSTISQWKNPRE